MTALICLSFILNFIDLPSLKRFVFLLSTGPFYNYLLKMESLRGGSRLEVPNRDVRVVGTPVQIEGKVGKALSLNGGGQYIDGGKI